MCVAAGEMSTHAGRERRGRGRFMRDKTPSGINGWACERYMCIIRTPAEEGVKRKPAIGPACLALWD